MAAFIITYAAIRVALIILFYAFKKSDWEEHGESVIMINMVSMLFYVSLLLQGSGLILLSMVIIIVANVKKLCEQPNKYVSVISTANIGEWITVFVPTILKYFDRPLFLGASFEIYFLSWKIV